MKIIGTLVIVIIWICVAAVCYEITAIILAEHRKMPDSTIAGDWDTRSRVEIIRDLRRRSMNAVPVMTSGVLSDLLSKTASIDERSAADWLFLGGVSNSLTVLCNEVGVWQTYHSDELGLNNPIGLWGNIPVDVVFLGDSHTHGHCVSAEQNFAAIIRQSYTRTVNLGGAGSGPLSELAALREFGHILKPKSVFWVFYEGNDIGNLNREKKNRYYSSYLDPEHRQENFEKKELRDSVMNKYIESELPQLVNNNNSWTKTILSHLREILGFGRLRRALRIIPYEFVDRPVLGKILSIAKSSVEDWGGKFYFIYLPSYYRYVGLPGISNYHEHIRTEVLSLAKGLNLEVIDMHLVFTSHNEPLNFFNKHISVEGHKKVAEEVRRVLVSKNLQ